jgi:alpha-tubulin suppressor-like RCC1 family protein
VYGLGYNGFGILGDGTLTNATKPAKFQLPGTLKAQAVGVNALSAGMSAFVITTDGQVYGSGANNYGQLGNGTTATRQSTPVRFNLPAGVKAAKIFVHGEATYVITTAGEVYCAGAGTQGQLGNGAASSSSTPVKMTLPVGEKAVMIEADAHSVYIAAESGKAYFTGLNDWGQSGNGTLGGQVNTPIRFYPNAGDAGEPTVRQVATDGAAGWVVLSDGTVWGVGRSMYGALGNSTAPSGSGNYVTQYKQFEITDRAVQIATDYGDLIVLADTGKVYGAGRNDSGELGCGDTVQHSVPCQTLIPGGLLGKYIINTGDGLTGIYDRYSDNTLVLTTNGKAYAMGDNYYGQLGIGSFGSPQSTPQLMILPNGIQAQSIRAGAGTAVALGSDGRVYGVGNNNYGQLGTGDTTNLSTPTATNYLNLRPAVLF